MSVRVLRVLALASLAAVILTLLVQMGGRANRAYDAATPVRNDMRAITVLFDRGPKDMMLYHGWGDPKPDAGAVSVISDPILLLPTSTARGDVEVTLVMASTVARTRPVGVQAGETTTGHRLVGTWIPKGAGEETVRVIAPSAQRMLSYQLRLDLDLAGANGEMEPVRIVSASTRILRDR